MNFSIGLSGLRAAQQALELVGTNLANANTEGYHRQEIQLSPIELGESISSASGVQVSGAKRTYDVLLERENLRQQPLLGQLDQELQGLYSIEAVMGQVDNNPLGESIRNFFTALSDLAADSTSVVYAQQVVWSADAAATNFNNMAEFLNDMKLNIRQQAESLIEEVNNQAESIARLSHEIEMAIARGASANVLFDQRDEAINKLAKLADISITNLKETSGNVNISAWGIPIVLNANYRQLDVSLAADNKLGIKEENQIYCNSTAGYGEIGGLMTLYNEVVAGLEEKLDTLAQQVMYEFNAIQTQGIGAGGSFTSLDGTLVDTTETLSDWEPAVTNGLVTLRLISPSGVATSYDITINSGDTIADVIDDINLLSPGNITANIVNSSLHITTANDYKFDFVPDNTITTDGSDGTSGLAGEGGGVGIPSVETSGIYQGSNQTYNLKFVVPAGSGEIGVQENISLEVRNGAGELVKTISLGDGYAAGDNIEIEDGLYVSFSQGTVNNGEDFSIIARSDTDTAGFLISAGLNTFFEGAGALDMAVRSEFFDNPSLLATAIGTDGSDNVNAARMAELSDIVFSGLDGKEVMEYFNAIGTEIGQQVMVRESRQLALEATVLELQNQRDGASGVDPNTEAAKLLIYERMFQAMSKFITVQDESLQNLLDVL